MHSWVSSGTQRGRRCFLHSVAGAQLVHSSQDCFLINLGYEHILCNCWIFQPLQSSCTQIQVVESVYIIVAKSTGQNLRRKQSLAEVHISFTRINASTRTKTMSRKLSSRLRPLLLARSIICINLPSCACSRLLIVAQGCSFSAKPCRFT